MIFKKGTRPKTIIPIQWSPPSWRNVTCGRLLLSTTSPPSFHREIMFLYISRWKRKRGFLPCLKKALPPAIYTFMLISGSGCEAKHLSSFLLTEHHNSSRHTHYLFDLTKFCHISVSGISTIFLKKHNRAFAIINLFWCVTKSSWLPDSKS